MTHYGRKDCLQISFWSQIKTTTNNKHMMWTICLTLPSTRIFRQTQNQRQRFADRIENVERTKERKKTMIENNAPDWRSTYFGILNANYTLQKHETSIHIKDSSKANFLALRHSSIQYCLFSCVCVASFFRLKFINCLIEMSVSFSRTQRKSYQTNNDKSYNWILYLLTHKSIIIRWIQIYMFCLNI